MEAAGPNGRMIGGEVVEVAKKLSVVWIRDSFGTRTMLDEHSLKDLWQDG
ncbi:hypothetical protein [Zafaria cholistanensis]|nr:hypothetical protein [Zafaria cholistanensis]